MNHWKLVLGAAVLAGPTLSHSALAGDPKSSLATSGGDWEYSISAGAAYRKFGTIKTNSGYRSSALVLPSFVGGNALVTPPIGGPGNRIYDDGFVGEDAGTGIDGSTWNWGYDRDDQVDTINDQLVFRATGFQSIRSDFRNAPLSGPSSRRDLDGFSPRLQFDARSPHQIGGFRLGFSAGIDFVNSSQSLNFSNFSLTQIRDDYRLDYTDRYNLNGVIPPLAPYQGSLGGPGPVIGYFPTSSPPPNPVLLTTDTATFSNRVSSSVDVNSITLNFGPSLGMQRGRYDFSVSAGVTLNIYDWKAKQSESLAVTGPNGVTSTFATWSERDQGITLRPGIYLQGETSYALTESLGLTGFLRLDTAGDFRIGSGPTGYKIDPNGVTAGIMLRIALP